MDQPLAGRRALVTGASRGIGRAITVALARAGADVAVNARAAERLADTADEVRDLGRRCVLVPADVTDGHQVRGMVEQAAAELGGIDILINNAGGGLGARLVEDIQEDEWDGVLALNVKSVFLTCKAVAPRMAEQGGGCIVNVSSVAGKYKPEGATSAAYAAAKSAVLGITRHLTVLLMPMGIRVNAVLPDDTLTDDVRRWWDGLSDEARRDHLRLNPAGRLAAPLDIADVVVLLCSDGARFVSGESLGITGGRYMG